MVLESFLGDILVNNDGVKFSTSTLSTDKGGVIALYFPSGWHHGFVFERNELASLYMEIKEAGKDFEIISVSSDRDNDTFETSVKKQPWLAIPYSNVMRNALKNKYRIRKDTLVLLEADTGHTICTNGHQVLMKYGANGFPFSEQRLTQCRREILQKKERTLTDNLDFLTKVKTVEKPDANNDLCEMIGTSEALALAFIKVIECDSSTAVLKKLLSIQQSIGREKLGVIIISVTGESEEVFPPNIAANMKSLPVIIRGHQALEFTDRFKPAFEDFDVPQVVVVNERDAGSVKLLSESAGRAILSHGKDAFPWSEEAIEAKVKRYKAFTDLMKTKRRNLEFLTPNNECHIIDKYGTEVSLATLQSKDVVGLYFSRKGSSLVFTTELMGVYNECKEQQKSFEIICISVDEDEGQFEGYDNEMPWLALKHEDRLMRDALVDIFNVRLHRSLILLKTNGEEIIEDGRAVVSMGSDYFPWSPEQMERGRIEEQPERKAAKLVKAKEYEEKCYVKQRESGKIPLRRHKGKPSDVMVGVDHVVRFGSFSTVTAPSAVITRGEKAWYEITMKERRGLSQVGWATNKFKGCDVHSSRGVGDDSMSWGFDGQRRCKWFDDGSTTWGKEIKRSGDHVLGVALDMQNGKILYGLNGDWGEPMGEAFQDLDVNIGLYPAITCSEMKISVNFGDREMIFGPPDDSFEKVMDVVNNDNDINNNGC